MIFDRNTKRTSWLAAGVILLFAILSVGCGDSSATYVPVSGMVTLNGQPLPDAQISFVLQKNHNGDPVDGRAPVASATTNEQGRFRLATFTPAKTAVDGAAVGTHRVAITTQIIQPGEALQPDRIVRAELLPAKYHSASELMREVPSSGTDACNFELDSS